MSSICISNCLNDAKDPKKPMRATYMNLYKWPGSDAEFLRSRTSSVPSSMDYSRPSVRVIDSISCRQMYLRSYRFSKKETVPEKTMKCFGKVKEKMGHGGRKKKKKKKKKKSSQRRVRVVIKRKCLVWRKVKVVLFRVFNRFLSCYASLDVLDQRNV